MKEAANRSSLANNIAELAIAESRCIVPLDSDTRQRVVKFHQALHTCLHFLATSSCFPALRSAETRRGNQTDGCNYHYRFHSLTSPTLLPGRLGRAAPGIVTSAAPMVRVNFIKYSSFVWGHTIAGSKLGQRRPTSRKPRCHARPSARTCSGKLSDRTSLGTVRRPHSARDT
jgi:hypothetical protein